MARLDRELLWRTGVMALLLLWPLLLFGRPAHIGDSAAYLKGGKVAVEFVLSKIVPEPPVQTAGATLPPNGDETGFSTGAGSREAPKGVRSVTYSAAAYLLRWPGVDMTALAIAQIVLTAFVIAVALTALGVEGLALFAALGAVLAFATPLAPATAYAVPDIFSGLIIVTIMLLALFPDRMSTGVRLAVACLTIFAITVHASIPPVALGMLLVCGVILPVARRYGLERRRGAWVWLAAPVALGMIANTAVGYVAFGEVSVAAKRYPVALTRSVVDGPARWYLEQQCVKPRYAICEVFGTRIPDNINDFLFNDTGLNGRATPEQMDRIRAEESEIVLRAAMAYPGREAFTLARNLVRQIFRYNVEVSRFRDRVVRDASGVPEIGPTGAGTSKAIASIRWLNQALLILCIGWLVLRASRLDTRERAALVLLGAALVGNAATAVMFSSVAARYQSRVIWLVPLFVLGMAAYHYVKSRNVRRVRDTPDRG